MMEEGTLRIVKRGSGYQVRYAANNPRALDYQLTGCEFSIVQTLRSCMAM